MTPLDMRSVSLVAFDLDDTLTVSKSRIETTTASMLASLTRQLNVCIISGGTFQQFAEQVLRFLPANTEKSRLHLMPTCGTQYFRWDSRDWTKVYSEGLTQEERSTAITALTEVSTELGFWGGDTWGPQIEDRETQITFSALGQKAPPSAKKAWDPDGRKRQELRSSVATRLPSLEVTAGGSTSVDVTRKGIDKSYGITRLLGILQLQPDAGIFVGDRLDPGGNDYPVRRTGVTCIAVDDPEDTRTLIHSMLTSLANS